MSTDTNRPHDGETAEQRVTITLEDCTLPSDKGKREAALAELKDKFEAALTEQRDPTSITTTTGHHFTQINDECPRCGGTLKLRDYTYCNGGAVAEANCIHNPDCKWRGQAVYRLIDLAGGPIRNGESAVTTGEMEPTYYPYQTE